MKRDNTAFKDRFQRWKNGEQVYENGRVIPHYEGGSDGTYYGNSRIEPITGEAGNLGGITVYGKKPKYNYLKEWAGHTHPLTFSDLGKGIETATAGFFPNPILLADDVMNERYGDAFHHALRDLTFAGGPVGKGAIMGLGASGLLSEDGVQKTVEKFGEGDIWGGTKSLVGDVLNAAMTVYGGKGLNDYANKIADRVINTRLQRAIHPPVTEVRSTDVPLLEHNVPQIENTTQRPLLLAENPRSKYVDSEGNVNMRNVVKLVRQFYDEYPNARNYKQVLNNSGNLYQHTKDVVKSAQDIPVPEGFTRQQLVQSALFHDIGKVINPDHSHGKSSVDILKDLDVELDPQTYDAIQNHMSSGMLDKSNLTRALHFADVARGDSWDVAAFKYPHLAYPFKKPKLNMQPMSVRDELKYKINPWLRNKGYKTIKLDVSEEEAWKQLEDRIMQHRSFLRGARDPWKPGGIGEDLRNKENSIKLLEQEYDMPRFLAESNEAEQLRTHVSLTNVPLDPTGSGRSSLFAVHEKNGLPVHHKTPQSTMIGANPKTKDGLYVSTSDDIGNNYATSTDDRYGTVGVVGFPIRPRVPGESMSEYLLKNDYDIVNLEQLDGHRTGSGHIYEDPYRLQTGRSLQSDMKKAGLVKPAFKRNYNSIIFPEDVDPRTGLNYKSVLSKMNEANEILKNFGIKFQFSIGSHGGIIKPGKLTDVAYNISGIDKLVKQLDNPPMPFPPVYHPASPFISQDVMETLGGNDPTMPYELLQQIAEEEEYNIENGISPNQGSGIFKRPKGKRNMETWPSAEMQLLERSGIITKKQYEATKKAFKYWSPNPSKYINPEKIIQSYIDNYINSVKGKHFKAYTPDYKNFKIDPKEMAKFVREQGVLPRYEIEGYGDDILYAIEGPEKNKTINQPLETRIYGYVLGDKGEHVLDLNEDLGYTHRVAGSRGSRDSGARSSKKITRKTFRNLIPPILGGYGIYTQSKDDKR